MRPVTLSELSA